MLNTDLDALREDYIYDYGDSVRATLYKDPTLGGSTALDEIAIERERYIIPFDFAGNKVAMYELTLTVLLTEQREGC
jgi:hypothetical protein